METVTRNGLSYLVYLNLQNEESEKVTQVHSYRKLYVPNQLCRTSNVI